MDLSLLEANKVLRMLTNHALRGHNREISRIIENLMVLSRAGQGEFSEEQIDHRINLAKAKLLSELDLIPDGTKVNRIT